MKSIRNFITERLRVCCICHLSSGKELGLCPNCFQRLEQKVSDGTLGRREQFGSYQGRKFDHSYLLDWRWSDQDLEAIVYSLKGGGNPKVFLELAKLMITHRFKKKLQKATFIYPSKGPRDHGYAWAKGLSEVYGFPLVELRLARGARQSRLSRGMRFGREFEKRRLKGNLIFVDDILTTGATAIAAYKALGQPKELAIWTIFYRPLL